MTPNGWDDPEAKEYQAGLDDAKKRDAIIESSTTEIVNFVQSLLDRIMADEANALWDKTPDGKKRYLATLLHETAEKLGLTHDEIKEASLNELW